MRDVNKRVLMQTNFHENYASGEIKPPSERSTGLVFAAVAFLFAALWRNSPTAPWVAVSAGLGLAAVSLIAPVLLRPISSLWFRFGLALHRVVNPVVMLAVYAAIFVPAGVIMRLWRDPLRSTRATGASTYWIERRKNGHAEESMINQF